MTFENFYFNSDTTFGIDPFYQYQELTWCLDISQMNIDKEYLELRFGV